MQNKKDNTKLKHNENRGKKYMGGRKWRIDDVKKKVKGEENDKYISSLDIYKRTM